MKIKLTTIFISIFLFILGVILLFVPLISDEDYNGGMNQNIIGMNLSPEVLKFKPMVERYAQKYDVQEYINYLLAIMQVESGGTLVDVMQSSESLGLPPNTLGTEESIEQGCRYFSNLLKTSKEKGCDIEAINSFKDKLSMAYSALEINDTWLAEFNSNYYKEVGKVYGK